MLTRSRAALSAMAVVALVGGAQAATGRLSAGPRTHVVARGETLSELAARLGVSPAELARANRIADPDRVRAGQRLVVPRQGRSSARRQRLPDDLRRRPERMAMMSRLDAAARAYGVPADLFKAVTWMESGWQNDKVSSTNARGIGQLMPDTVTFVNERLLHRRLDPRRPDDNMAMSARFLRYLLDETGGDVPRALASYYQGLASVRRQGPLPVTREYVAAVLALRARF